jgi:hypothetical protein
VTFISRLSPASIFMLAWRRGSPPILEPGQTELGKPAPPPASGVPDTGAASLSEAVAERRPVARRLHDAIGEAAPQSERRIAIAMAAAGPPGLGWQSYLRAFVRDLDRGAAGPAADVR